MERFVLAIDQGTTRTKAALFDSRGRPRGFGFAGLESVFPEPGWVEQDPLLMWNTVLRATRQAMHNARCKPQQIVGVGLDNQGETVVAWDKKTGRPIYNAISWQCRRTEQACKELRTRKRLIREIRRKTGLFIDPYFSATKLRWLIDNTKKARKLRRSRQLALGTSDSWLIWKMTGKEVVVTDCSTASRTMLFNIHQMKWDEDILTQFGITQETLASIVANSGYLAHTDPNSFLRIDAPITGLIVDQQAALFGHGCFKQGDLKNTYGTGCFTLMNIGESPKLSHFGLLTTVAWVINGVNTYALDGGVYAAGSIIDWLVDRAQILRTRAESSAVASSASGKEAVYFVPAFSGLAAPYWDSTARGAIVGMTYLSGRATIVRAALESVAYQVEDILHCMRADTGVHLKELAVDGGLASNQFLMQFQADISGMPVAVPNFPEVTVKGTALLAGEALEFWDETLKTLTSTKKRLYRPRMTPGERTLLLGGWKQAVARSRKWCP